MSTTTLTAPLADVDHRAPRTRRAARLRSLLRLLLPVSSAPVVLVDDDAAELPEQPTSEAIESALAQFDSGREAANAAARQVRAARKLVDLLADGLYGPWRVEREPSNRKRVDEAAVAAFYAAHGAEVPMLAYAPTLKVTRVS